jgi:FtsH-binding integral membrane protein
MHKHYISIWFFIGALLLVYGILITAAEFYGLSHPPPQPVVLAQYHAGLWWGVLLIILGGIYVIRFRPGKQ